MLLKFIRTLYTEQCSIPRKLILIYTEQQDVISKALAERIKRELRAVYLSSSETDKLIDSPQVPYTVIITERTLVDGVLELQHYFPKIKEQVHVTNLRDRLLLQSGAVMLRSGKEKQ